MTQIEKVLATLEAGNEITPLCALNEFGSFRLSSIIHDLRRRGHDIETRMIETPSGARHASYRLNPNSEILP